MAKIGAFSGQDTVLQNRVSTEQENIKAIWKEINNGFKDCEL
jgi:hypothetical protein